MVLYTFLAAFLIMMASLVGIIFVSRYFARLLERYLKVLVAFAVGVFAVLAYSLLDESLELGLSPALLIFSAVVGALSLELISRIIPHAHHHHEPSKEHAHSKTEAHRMLLGDAVHNISDGIILVPAFLANIWLGIATAVGIFLHELVQEIAEFFVLREAGYSTKEALIRNFLVSATILVGVVLALLVVSIKELEAPFLAFAAGGFLYIIFRDLVPSIARAVRAKGNLPQFIIAALLGAAMMAGVGVLTPHSHEHADEEHTSGEHDGEKQGHEEPHEH